MCTIQCHQVVLLVELKSNKIRHRINRIRLGMCYCRPVTGSRSWRLVLLFCTLNQLNKVWHLWPGSNDFIGAPSNAIKWCWWRWEIHPVELADVAIHSHVGHP